MSELSPAIDINPQKPPSELTSQEFQQLLTSFFDEKGLKQDMKSYLKFQLINLLKNTVIGKNIRDKAQKGGSLSQQALHLIVAEYLLQNQCNFALSLFVSEVNLSDNRLLFEEPGSKVDKGNLTNILELIGIDKNGAHFYKIVDKYFNTSESILTCLLGLVAKQEQNVDVSDMEIDEDFMKNVNEILQSANLPRKLHLAMLHKIKLHHDLQRKTFENQVVELINRFKKELDSRDFKLKRFEKRKKHLEKRISRMRDIELKECDLKHCTEACANIRTLNEEYKRQVDRLQEKTLKQGREIEELTLKCREMVEDFNNCQMKINFCSLKVNEDLDVDVSPSSDSLTLDILEEQRVKLKMLEEESEQLDLRFNTLTIK